MKEFVAEFFTREFAKKVVTSAISLTAANYTAKGIQKVIDHTAEKIYGKAASRSKDGDEEETTDITPTFDGD